MKISDRFTDYGLIGGFFWLLQLAVWLVIAGRNGWSDYLQRFTTTLNILPASAIAPFMALLGAIGLVAVFTTGLFLDLLGSFNLRAVERLIFVNHARQHCHWFQRFADLHSAYLQEDWSLLLSVPPYKTQLRESLKGLKVWNIRDMKDSWLLTWQAFESNQAYARMQSFLLSYMLLSSGVEKLELLSTQMALWITGRAIATAFLVSVLDIFFWLHGWVGTGHVTVLVPLVVVVQLLFGILAFSVAASSYGRFCSTMFALVYLVNEKGTPSVPPVPMSLGVPRTPQQPHDE
jgi:hypothetical protein